MIFSGIRSPALRTIWHIANKDQVWLRSQLVNACLLYTGYRIHSITTDALLDYWKLLTGNSMSSMSSCTSEIGVICVLFSSISPPGEASPCKLPDWVGGDPDRMLEISDTLVNVPADR